MRSDWSSLHTAVSRTALFVMLVFERILGAIHTAVWVTSDVLQQLGSGLQTLYVSAYERTSAVLTGPVKRLVVGPLRVVLLGKRREVSLLVALLSPGLALVTAWWVGSTLGYETLTTWVRRTWFGIEPSLAVFLAVGGLLALGAISAGINSGLLPTSLLVSAPIFGAALTRYGTTVTYTWGTEVVSLPNAVGVAGLFALGFGLPLTIAGFVLGRVLRHVVPVS